MLEYIGCNGSVRGTINQCDALPSHGVACFKGNTLPAEYKYFKWRDLSASCLFSKHSIRSIELFCEPPYLIDKVVNKS